MDKPARSYPRPLSAFLHQALSKPLARQGFASTELLTRWTEIVGPELSRHSQPEKIQWPRGRNDDEASGTLVLRVEGPTAVEIQHLSSVVLERVNRFFGWQAVGSLRLRQAPLRRRSRTVPPEPDAQAAARIAAGLTEITDENLRSALARLGAAIKPT
jgi:hypothetical protein